MFIGSITHYGNVPHGILECCSPPCNKEPKTCAQAPARRDCHETPMEDMFQNLLHCAKSRTPLHVSRTAPDCMRYALRACSGSATSILSACCSSPALADRAPHCRGRPPGVAFSLASSHMSFAACNFCASSVFPLLSGWTLRMSFLYPARTSASVASRDKDSKTEYNVAKDNMTLIRTRQADKAGETAILRKTTTTKAHVLTPCACLGASEKRTGAQSRIACCKTSNELPCKIRYNANGSL